MSFALNIANFCLDIRATSCAVPVIRWDNQIGNSFIVYTIQNCSAVTTLIEFRSSIDALYGLDSYTLLFYPDVKDLLNYEVVNAVSFRVQLSTRIAALGRSGERSPTFFISVWVVQYYVCGVWNAFETSHFSPLRWFGSSDAWNARSFASFFGPC